MKSFIPYVGGKSKLVKKLLPLFPKHTCYAEVFGGAAWLLFAKEPARVEILNDVNSDLTTLYRVVKNHLEEFVRYFKYALVSRDEWNRLRKEEPSTLTDIQRAARFYYLLRNSFGAKLCFNSFASTATRPPRLNLLRIEEDLSAAHLRLAQVVIENLPYGKLIQKYDRPETFFYVDPPYFGCEDYYGHGIFSREDFGTLRDLLGGIKGRFLMSINDTPEVREMYRDFTIRDIRTLYSLQSNGQKAVSELVITNYLL